MKRDEISAGDVLYYRRHRGGVGVKAVVVSADTTDVLVDLHEPHAKPEPRRVVVDATHLRGPYELVAAAVERREQRRREATQRAFEARIARRATAAAVEEKAAKLGVATWCTDPAYREVRVPVDQFAAMVAALEGCWWRFDADQEDEMNGPTAGEQLKTMVIRLVNRTGKPLVLRGSRRLEAAGVPFPPLCGEDRSYTLDVPSASVPMGTYSRNGVREDPFVRLVYNSGGEHPLAEQLPPIAAGTYHVLPRELVLADRSLRQRRDVLVVDDGGDLARVAIDDQHKALQEQLLLLQEARFLVTQDAGLTVREALHTARGVNAVGVWTWHLLLGQTPIGREAYESGDAAPMEEFQGAEAIIAMTAVIDRIRRIL